MTLTLESLHPSFVAQAHGVDLSRPQSRETIGAIHEALDAYGVLVFRNQPLTPCQQAELARCFGPLDKGLLRVRNRAGELAFTEPADAADRRHDEWLVDRIDTQSESRRWHCDSSFQNPTARYSMLAAVRVPETGGDIEFADLRVAYETLPEEVKRNLVDLAAEHYAFQLQSIAGESDDALWRQQIVPPATWPLVRTHPGSGRSVLFVSSHARAIRGCPLAEGRSLLSDLLEHATRRELVYRHHWEPNDLVIWDNRCTLHRGRRFDRSFPRELRLATTLDLDTEIARHIA